MLFGLRGVGPPTGDPG